MSRDWEDYGDDRAIPYEFWDRATTLALRGKRGQAHLRELIGVLDAMPHKALADGVLCRRPDQDEYPINAFGIDWCHVPYEGAPRCALGEWAHARGIPDAELQRASWDITLNTSAEFGADRLGLRITLAGAIAEANDREWYGTDEQRWQAVRRWAYQQLSPANREGVPIA